MLQRISVDAALASLGEFRPTDYAFRATAAREGWHLFADDPQRPAVLLAISGADVMVHFPGGTGAAAGGPNAALQAAMQDLFARRIENDLWPDDAARKDWSRWESEYIFLNTSSVSVWDAGLGAGFKAPDDFKDGAPSYLYWWEGPPRYGDAVRHSCRLGRGMELFEQLRQGVHYDEDGAYVRAILAVKPSFVCEVNGEPVCWSTIHLNGTMGMIYTPEQHRRHGYGRSLSAFQIDHQLRAERFACCHVFDDNVASSTMLLGLGGQKADVPIIWRVLLWP